MESVFGSWIFWVIAGSLFLYVLIKLLTPSNADAARKIKDNLESTYVPTHEYVPASPGDFPGLDLAFYDRATADLEAAGFRRLGDMENLTLSRANPSMRTFIRILVSRDGTVGAGIYDIRLRGWARCLQGLGLLPKKLSTVDLETEFPDGRFLVTHNSPQAALMKSPPQFDVEVHSAETGADALLEAHLERLRRRLAAEPAIAPCVVRTLDDALASQKRQDGIKHAFRRSVGWVTREEMEGMAGPCSKQAARDVHDEIRKLDRDDRRR